MKIDAIESDGVYFPLKGGIDMSRKIGFDKEKHDREYDAANTTQVKMKLNLKTDADILKKLEEVGNKQGYIKALIRQDLMRYNKLGGEP